MKRNEAIEYDNYLKKELKQIAIEYNLEAYIGAQVIDNYITIIPEDARRGMIFLGQESVSYKFGNIKFDFRKALIAGLELVASISRPESIFNYIQLLIVTAFFIEKATKQEITILESYIVYLLHTNGIYKPKIEEERFIEEFQKFYKEKEGKTIEEKEVKEAINHMCEIKIVDIEDEKPYLIETVWMRKK